jgi:two-component system, NarL family, sensor histidine kinase UhpB
MRSESVPENNPLHILILEDNPIDAELIEEALEEAGIAFISRCVETEEFFLTALGDFSPDLILSDYNLPKINGAQALSLTKEHCPDVPFILVTGAIGEERAIDVLKSGATDYVLKNRLSRLIPAIKRALQEAEERKERRWAEEERDVLLRQLEVRVQERTAELETSREKIKAILNSITDIYISFDHDWNFTDLNQQAEKIFGKKRDELLGKVFWEVFPQMKEVEHFPQYEAAMASQTPMHFEAQLMITGRWYEMHTYPSEEGLSFYLRDITERKQMEDALCQSRDNLENQVQERTRELEEAIEKQRLLAAELLMTEVRERRRIAADLHDNICQSLAVAKLRLHDLQARATEIDLEKPLIEIKEMIGDALHHTRSLLQEISPSILHELGLSAALDALAEQINTKYGLAVILESPQSICKIDEEMQILLFQAARELLLNIIKHAKVSAASVSIQEIGSNIRVQVKDDGVGFDVSSMQTMFNRSGGFGLFNIRERLKHWDGHMEIKSGHGMGTCITISVPHKKRSQQHNKKERVN